MTITLTGFAGDYPKGTRIASHRHDTHQIVHASAGVMRVRGGGAWVVPPGRAVWVPAGFDHAIRCVSAVSMRTLYLKGSHRCFPGACAVWNVSPLMREIMVRVAVGCESHQTPHFLALLMDEIRVVHSAPLFIPEPRHPGLRQLAAALFANPADRRTLTDWAGRLATTPRTLIRHLKQETGMGFRAYRRQIRALAALERLALGESVTAVAYTVGYDSPSAFIETFRQIFGATPGKYFPKRPDEGHG